MSGHGQNVNFDIGLDAGPRPEDRRGTGPRTLSEADAIEIWIARWRRIPRKALVARYGCDPRRLYEIWWGERYPAAREKAASTFRERYPGLVGRTVFGYRRIPRGPVSLAGHQLELFE